jgi:hypothetical protein
LKKVPLESSKTFHKREKGCLADWGNLFFDFGCGFCFVMQHTTTVTSLREPIEYERTNPEVGLVLFL